MVIRNVRDGTNAQESLLGSQQGFLQLGRGELGSVATWLNSRLEKGRTFMSSETMINSMGGSIKETIYKGALGPPRKPLEKAWLLTCLFSSPQPLVMLLACAGPLGPA